MKKENFITIPCKGFIDLFLTMSEQEKIDVSESFSDLINISIKNEMFAIIPHVIIASMGRRFFKAELTTNTLGIIPVLVLSKFRELSIYETMKFIKTDKETFKIWNNGIKTNTIQWDSTPIALSK